MSGHLRQERGAAVAVRHRVCMSTTLVKNLEGLGVRECFSSSPTAAHA